LELPLTGGKNLYVRPDHIEAIVEHTEDACHIRTISGHRYDVYTSAEQVMSLWHRALIEAGDALKGLSTPSL
jgi:uncharacterized protein YlzI (FlbEa/FlbD family)